MYNKNIKIHYIEKFPNTFENIFLLSAKQSRNWGYKMLIFLLDWFNKSFELGPIWFLNGNLMV